MIDKSPETTKKKTREPQEKRGRRKKSITKMNGALDGEMRQPPPSPPRSATDDDASIPEWAQELLRKPSAGNNRARNVIHDTDNDSSFDNDYDETNTIYSQHTHCSAATKQLLGQSLVEMASPSLVKNSVVSMEAVYKTQTKVSLQKQQQHEKHHSASSSRQPKPRQMRSRAAASQLRHHTTANQADKSSSAFVNTLDDTERNTSASMDLSANHNTNRSPSEQQPQTNSKHLPPETNTNRSRQSRRRSHRRNSRSRSRSVKAERLSRARAIASHNFPLPSQSKNIAVATINHATVAFTTDVIQAIKHQQQPPQKRQSIHIIAPKVQDDLQRQQQEEESTVSLNDEPDFPRAETPPPTPPNADTLSKQQPQTSTPLITRRILDQSNARLPSPTHRRREPQQQQHEVRDVAPQTPPKASFPSNERRRPSETFASELEQATAPILDILERPWTTPQQSVPLAAPHIPPIAAGSDDSDNDDDREVISGTTSSSDTEDKHHHHHHHHRYREQAAASVSSTSEPHAVPASEDSDDDDNEDEEEVSTMDHSLQQQQRGIEDNHHRNHHLASLTTTRQVQNPIRAKQSSEYRQNQHRLFRFHPRREDEDNFGSEQPSAISRAGDSDYNKAGTFVTSETRHNQPQKKEQQIEPSGSQLTRAASPIPSVVPVMTPINNHPLMTNTEESKLPLLHAALYRGASLPELYKLVGAAKKKPSLLQHKDHEFGNTPLHIACAAPRLAMANQQQGTHHPYYGNDSLLLVIQMIYNLCPENIERTNNAGELPVHLAVASAVSVVSNSKTNAEEYYDGEQGSSISSMSNTKELWLDVLEKLIFEYPKALRLRTKVGQSALDLAVGAEEECPEIVALIQQEMALLGEPVRNATTRPAASHKFVVPWKWRHVGGMTMQMPGLDAGGDGGISGARGPTEPPFEDEESADRKSLASNNKSLLLEASNDYARMGATSQFAPFRRRWCPCAGRFGRFVRQLWSAFVSSKTSLIIASLVVLAGLLLLPQSLTHRPIRVAFIGNSITFVNDLPRFMEGISSGRISQNSCLHGATRLRTILYSGNGMFNKWKTVNALIRYISPEEELYGYIAQGDDDDDGNGGDDDGGDDDGFTAGDPYPLFDFGACTIPQLLFGVDDSLQIDNGNGKYKDDGKNPCLEDPVYFQYQKERYLELLYAKGGDAQSGSSLDLWDYVVLNDQTNTPAMSEEREKSEQVLKYVYAPYFNRMKARPVLLMTHAYAYNASVDFDSDYDDTWQDVPTFTSALYYGYQRYADTLSDALPQSQAPLIAPAGLAFLTVWEENRDMWEKLFFVDGFHPTPHGTFLIGCVLYATLYQKMPANIPDDVGNLWSRARRMHIGQQNDYNMPIPTRDEAIYLASIAKRVTLKKHMPASLDLSYSD